MVMLRSYHKTLKSLCISIEINVAITSKAKQGVINVYLVHSLCNTVWFIKTWRIKDLLKRGMFETALLSSISRTWINECSCPCLSKCSVEFFLWTILFWPKETYIQSQLKSQPSIDTIFDFISWLLTWKYLTFSYIEEVYLVVTKMIL